MGSRMMAVVGEGRSQAEPEGMRESGGAIWPMVSGGAEGGRSQSGADVSTGRGGVMGPEAGGRDRGSSVLDGARGLKTLGRSSQHVGDTEGRTSIATSAPSD